MISWIVVGLIAGWLAGKVMREGGYGLVGDIVVGVLGGLLGGYLATKLFHIKQAVTGINVESILVALAGAVVLLVGLRLLGGGSRRRSILR
ncbi:MAG TPA: GlsB/YeaQ/YmgE family stress response membrane protein [Anaerolineales bacterium]|nr:GlsB/YeaQ/YmgE family stress response membrane protein [Anaerolineales bacterium]